MRATYDHERIAVGDADVLREALEAVTAQTVGCVTRDGDVLAMPRLCLDLCLEGRADNATSRGCDWLRARVSGVPCREGEACITCPKGQRAEVRRTPTRSGATVIRVAPAAASDGSVDDSADATDALIQREEENIRLAEEVLQCYEQLNVLYEITSAFAKVRGVAALKRVALVRVAEMLNADLAFFFDEQGELTAEYEADPLLGRIKSGAWRSALRGAGKPIVTEVLKRGSAQAIQEQGENCGVDLPGPLLLIPLTTNERSIGVAGFSRERDGDPFLIGEQSMAEAVLSHAALNVQLYQLFDDLNQMSIDVVRAMVTAIDAKDNYTGGHSERVAQLSKLVGSHLGLSADELQILEWGARLHDVGKIGTRESVLGKTGPLTPEEFDHIKQHPVTSYEVLKPIHRLAPVLGGVRHHHEAWDGSGYPDGLAGEEIPYFARIIQAADVFDALTSTRSYRAAYTVDEALGIMRKGAGVKFDPKIVEAFEEVIRRSLISRPEFFRHIPQQSNARPASSKSGDQP